MSNSPDDSAQTSASQICSPGNVRAHRTSPTSATITWDEPYDQCPLCPSAAEYEVSGEGIVTRHVVRPPCAVTLRADVSYDLSIRAKAEGDNQSNPSWTHIGLSPGKPGNLSVKDISSNSAAVSWAAVSGDGQVVNYLIYLDGILLKWTRELSHQLISLEGNRSYTVEVRAQSLAGDLSDVALAQFSTPVTAPDYPRNLRETQNSGKTVAIAWDAPFGFTPTGYRVSVLGKTIDVAQTHHTLFNMPLGIPLTIGVRARYAEGDDSIWVFILVVPKP